MNDKDINPYCDIILEQQHQGSLTDTLNKRLIPYQLTKLRKILCGW